VKNCLKFIRNGGKNCNNRRCYYPQVASLQAILAYRHCSEFFNGNFSHAGSFSKLNVSFELRLFLQLLGCFKNVLEQ